MRYRKLTSDGDMNFGNSQNDFYRDSREGVAQAVYTRLGLWVTEWFLDVDEGTQWLQGVIGKQTATTRDSVLRDRILTTEGVTGITRYETATDPENRAFALETDIDTLFGETTVRQVVSDAF